LVLYDQFKGNIPPVGQEILELSKSYYEKEVRYFESEAEALTWLREQ